jgi:hypothetical protein
METQIRQLNPRRFYVYAYLRPDGTPYYIGRGQTNRGFCHKKQDCTKSPKDRSRIKILASCLTTSEADEWEIDLISIFGRIDLGTGCLRNLTDGGEGLRNFVRTEAYCKSISEALQGKPKSEEHKKALSQACKGRVISAQAAQKISEANGVKRNWAHKTHGQVFMTASELARTYLPQLKSCTATGYLSRVASGQKASAHGWKCLDAPHRDAHEHLPEELRWISPDGQVFWGTAGYVSRVTGLCRKALRRLAKGVSPRVDSCVYGWTCC